MNNELLAERNRVYQDQIAQIGKLIFHAFYYDEEEMNRHLPSEDLYEKESVKELLPKAEKVFQFFGDVEEAKKAIRFLNIVNPIKAKEIFDDL